MSKRKAIYRAIVSLVLLALLLFILVPQAGTLQHSLTIVRQASLLNVTIAVFMMVMTYVLSTELYWTLAKHPLRLPAVGLVQVATGLTSRIVPIGIGTMSLNAIFLRRQKHSLSEALAVVATNNGLGVVGHLVLLALISSTAPLPRNYSLHISESSLYWVLVIVSAIVIVLTVSQPIRTKISQALHQLIKAIASYRRHPRTICKAFGLNLTLSVVYVLTLMAVGQSLGVDLPFTHFFMIYTFSLLTGAATPTPGGLVGVEAGLTSALITYGVAADTALAVALLYRLITYWLPLIPGFIAFRLVQRRYF